MELTAKNVETIFKDCLFHDGEEISNPAMTEGILLKFGFHKERLDSHIEDISSMLSQLPKEFQKDGGGWYVFLECLQ